jgi:pantoate--beta-alanine ligase
MVRDLDFQVQLIGRPTVRERDGLALSSRNKYLSAQEREQAPALYAGLQDLRRVVQGGQTDVQSLLHRAKQYWSSKIPQGRLEYLEIVDPETLKPLQTIDGPALAAVAFYLGRARLIDNILLQE